MIRRKIIETTKKVVKNKKCVMAVFIRAEQISSSDVHFKTYIDYLDPNLISLIIWNQLFPQTVKFFYHVKLAIILNIIASLSVIRFNPQVKFLYTIIY